MPKLTNIDTVKKNMINALANSLGIVSTACKNVGISRQAHYLWMKEDADYKQKVEEVNEAVIDFAESELYKQIQDGSTAATIFYLKTKGKKRGYIEKTELDLNGEMKIETITGMEIK